MQEVNAVLRSLRGSGVQIQALHNHMLGDQPRLFFLHGSAVGSPLSLANITRAAMDKANFEKVNGGAGKG